MDKLKVGVIAAVVTVAVAIGMLQLKRNAASLKNMRIGEAGNPATGMSPVSPVGRLVPPRSEQISLKNRSKTAGIREYLERRKQDKSFDWRVPIRFYGRVIDERSQPIKSARIAFQWSDLSANGASEATTNSDAGGRFSLKGVYGKGLTVQVSKDGYDGTANSRGDFEFANPAESTYYEPNPDTPVIFQLRKKGEGADLIKKSVEVVLPGEGSSKAINLSTGKIQSGGDINVQSFKPWPPQPMSPHYDWKVSLTIPDGGFVEAHEEFPFEAPETVYEPTFEINMPATLGDAWKVSVEKTLYFTYGDPKRYGRLNLRTSANSRYVFIDYFVNPSGSRNLEPKSTPALVGKP